MICGNPDVAPDSCPDSDRIPGLTAAMISICDRTNSSACPGESHSAVTFGTSPDDGKADLVSVEINDYPFTFSIPFVSLGAIKFGRIYATMVQGGA
jgi:hypothetical protein